MKKIVLDTNAYSRLIGGDEEVEKTLSQADKILLPIFVIAELLYGFKNGKKEHWNRSVLKRFERKPTVAKFYVSDETAEIFSDFIPRIEEEGECLYLLHRHLDRSLCSGNRKCTCIL